MKKQILTLIIGILIGAVITAAIFLIFRTKGSRNAPDFSKFNPNGEEFDFSKRGERRNKENTDDKKVEDKQKEENTNEDKS